MPARASAKVASSDTAEWFAAQYAESVGLPRVEGGARFKNFLEAFPVGAEYGPYPITGRQRVMSGFLAIKLRYPLGPDGYSCLVMSAVVDGVSTHYAYAYWRRGQEADPPEYICVSPTYDSRDGEYRQRFIRGPVFLEAYGRLAQDLAPYEEQVIAMLAMAGAPFELRASAYPEDTADAVAARAEDLRLPILAFTVALALDHWQLRRGMLMAHTSAAYVALMVRVSSMIPDTFEGAPTLELRFNVFRDGLQRATRSNSNHPQCGQKIVPMHTREALQVNDFNLAAWRELAVTRLAGDLVLNFITPSFALYNQWTYIEGADAALFDNKAMAERYSRSEAVGAATRSLREARRQLGDAAQKNYYTEELSARVYDGIEYAQSYLLMSPVALVHTMEDVGRTLISEPALVRRSPCPSPAVAGAFATPDSAAHYLFELAYAAHCLHTKTGVAHTDLHGNNMTFYVWSLAERQSVIAERQSVTAERPDTVTFTPYYDDPVVAYVTTPRGEADTYIFPAAGTSACIIDYSRCILGPAFRPHLEEGRSPLYATLFYRDQVNRVMRAFHRYAPEYVAAHQNAIKAAVLANFEAAFPALCAVDFIAIGANVGALLLEARGAGLAGGVRPFEVAERAVALAERLEAVGRELLITGLHDLAETAGARRGSKPPEFPGWRVLESVFGEWRFPLWAARDPARARTAQLVDAYNYNNPVRYSGQDYARFPPWARLDEIERHLGSYKITDLFERGVEPFLEALRTGARVEVIAEQLRAQQEKLDGAPVSAASSWLDE